MKIQSYGKRKFIEFSLIYQKIWKNLCKKELENKQSVLHLGFFFIAGYFKNPCFLGIDSFFR